MKLLFMSPTYVVSSQIKYLYDQKALLDQLESSNVTTDLGGALRYDHNNWVHNRLVRPMNYCTLYTLYMYFCCLLGV